MTRRANGTTTSSFGVSGRFNHDSSRFYDSKLYSEHKPNGKKKFVENEIDSKILDKIFCQDSRRMKELPNNSVHLMVTSPPYNASKDYDEDLSLNEYLKLLEEVYRETHRVLVPGGRACINVANLGRKPYIPLASHINNIMLNIGYYMRGEIIWNKAASSGSSCAWGSWMSANNPTLRDVHEYILIYSKEKFDRKTDKESTITKEEFLEYTKSIWTFNTESARKIGHPAPFPIELPYRLIQLYTYKGDVILDPFCGSGSTCLASIKTKRHFIGYDIDKKYVKLANTRIKNYTSQLELAYT